MPIRISNPQNVRVNNQAKFFLHLPVHFFMRRLLAPLLLAFWLFANVPHDLLHALADHSDTVDPVSYSCPLLTPPHLHCQILQLQLDHYTSAPEFHLPAGVEFQQQLYSVIVEPVLAATLIYSSARAPPVLA